MPSRVYERKPRLHEGNGVQPNNPDAYNRPQPERSATSIKWTETELALLAQEWVLLRLQYPFANARKILNDVQNKVFAAATHRKRKIVSTWNKDLTTLIAKQWKTILDKPASPPEVVPQIVELQVPVPMSFTDMLHELDMPTLAAMMAAKKAEKESEFHLLLHAIAAKAGASPLPNVRAFTPSPLIAGATAKRPPRIGLIGLHDPQFADIRFETEKARIEVDLRFIDNGANKLSSPRCDYIIMLHGQTGRVHDLAVSAAGMGRIFTIMDGGTGSVLQKIRDIVSRQ